MALGRQLKELLPLLWLKAGAKGKCPSIENDSTMYIFEENQFAILKDERDFGLFEQRVTSNIKVIYFITDSEAGYREMSSYYEDLTTYQLYSDYLDNFRINVRR